MKIFLKPTRLKLLISTLLILITALSFVLTTIAPGNSTILRIVQAPLLPLYGAFVVFSGLLTETTGDIVREVFPGSTIVALVLAVLALIFIYYLLAAIIVCVTRKLKASKK